MQDEELRARVDRHLAALGALLLGGLCLLVYGRALRYGFFFDDLLTVVNNEGLARIPQWLADAQEGGPAWGELVHVLGKNLYRPVLGLTFVLDYIVWEKDAFGYHLTNVVLHAFNVLLVYMLASATLDRIVQSRRRGLALAFLVAAVFAFHPVQVESVVYISSRSNLLATFFILLSFSFLRWALLQAVRGDEAFWARVPAYVLGVALYILAVGAKEDGVMLPLYLVLWDWAALAFGEKDRRWKRRAAFYAPLVAVFGVLAWLRLSVFQAGDVGEIRPGAYNVAATHAAAYWKYFSLLLFPVGLSVDHGFPTWRSLFSPAPLLALAAHGAALALLVSLFRRGAHAAACALVALYLTLAPSTSFIALADAVVEHRAYLTVLAFAVLAVGAGTALLARFEERLRDAVARRRLRAAAAVAATALLVLLGAARVSVWASQERLWSDAAASNPDNPRPHYQLGAAYMMADRKREAVETFGKVLRLDPDFYLAAVNRGVLFMEMGDLDNAERNYRQALSARPDHTPSRYNLAEIYQRKGRYEEALVQIRRARATEPENAAFLEKEGNILEAVGKWEEALDRYASAVEGEVPDKMTLVRHMGYVALQNKSYETAKKWFERAAELDPESAENWYNLALFQEKRGDADSAVATYTRALVVDPAFARAHFNLARLLEQSGKCDEAGSHYRVAETYDSQYRGEYQAFRRGREEGLRCTGERDGPI